MNTLKIKTADGGYDIQIKRGIRKRAGEICENMFPYVKFAVVCDDNTFALCSGEFIKSFTKTPIIFVFPHGEKSKNIETVMRLCGFLSENGFCRDDVLIALGGGVCGDLCGFAASVYMRGCRFVQIPTSLLAMVDSSVGGKTAVDTSSGKNLIGSFHSPSLVLCDCGFLNTLPEKEFSAGIAEVIKTGFIGNTKILHLLAEKGDIEEITELCIDVKRSYVEADEFDTGKRKILNLGHTAAHAAEALSDYKITHGEAVAMGLYKIFSLCETYGLCDKSLTDMLYDLLEKYGLVVDCPYSGKELAAAVLHDKKRRGDTIDIIVPRDYEKSEILNLPLSELEDFFDGIWKKR